MKIIFPNQFYRPKIFETARLQKTQGDGPIFFLAGPIPGGGNWHLNAFDLLLEHAPSNSVVFSPNRFPADHPISGYNPPTEEHSHFLDQFEWEWYYMRLAAEEAKEGCLIFWFGKEDKYNPRNDGNPYGMMSRDEAGTWRQRMFFNRNARVVMGGDRDFPGIREIERYNDLVLSLDVLPVYHNMEETIKACVRLALAT